MFFYLISMSLPDQENTVECFLFLEGYCQLIGMLLNRFFNLSVPIHVYLPYQHKLVGKASVMETMLWLPG